MMQRPLLQAVQAEHSFLQAVQAGIRQLSAWPATRPSQLCCAPSADAPQCARAVSNKPDATVYSGPSADRAKRVSLRMLRQKYRVGEKLTMVTAYDYPSAAHVRAHIGKVNYHAMTL